MSRCAACNKVLTVQEMSIKDHRNPSGFNDLCSNCRGIVADPWMAEYIDRDGANAMHHQDQCPSDEDRGQGGK